MDASVARRMWLVGEPLHAVTYFAAESFAAWEAAGLHGFWRGYFATRAAPFGAVGPEVVTASFFNFAPSMVERALPSVWTMATPEDALVSPVRRRGSRAAGDRRRRPRASRCVAPRPMPFASRWPGARSRAEPSSPPTSRSRGPTSPSPRSGTASRSCASTAATATTRRSWPPDSTAWRPISWPVRSRPAGRRAALVSRRVAGATRRRGRDAPPSGARVGRRRGCGDGRWSRSHADVEERTDRRGDGAVAPPR